MSNLYCKQFLDCRLDKISVSFLILLDFLKLHNLGRAESVSGDRLLPSDCDRTFIQPHPRFNICAYKQI